MGIKHAKTSLVQTTGDPSLVGPTDWNADHIAIGTVDLSGATTVIAPVGGIQGITPILFVGAPTGVCTQFQTAIDSSTGNYYNCFGGAWNRVGPGSATLSSPVTSPNPLNLNVDLHFKGPNPYVDATRFGVRAVVASAVPAVPGITVNCTSGSPNVTISAASTFQNGDGVALYGCGSGTIGVPAAPTVTPSLAAAQTGTLLVVSGLTGSTTYCYQLVARTLMGAINVSPETCTNTGPASLGLQTNTITTVSLSNTTASYTTSAAHGLVVGAHVVITGVATNTANGQTNGSSVNIPFNGWFKVATVPDNTHFTVNLLSDSRNGAVTVGTGGTVSYWNSIHIKATETTNNYQYYVYGRVSGGTKTLIGTMWPQDVNLVGRLSDVTYLVFDDFGSTVTTFPNPPSYIPTTVPTVATNDMLATTIVSGAGTTSLVLANNAGNTINGATIVFDDAVTFLAAATTAANIGAGTNGPLMLPEPGNNALSYVFNSPISLGVGATSRVTVLQKGLVTLNEPISTTFVDWYGVPTSNSVAAAFANQRGIGINLNKCSPCFVARSNTYFYDLVWSMLSTNGSLGFIQESGGIPSSGGFRRMVFGTGTSTNYSNMALVFRGDGAGYDFSDTTLSGPQNGNLIANTPGMYFDNIGNAVFKTVSLSGIGIATRINAAGGFILADNVYCQGCYQPYFSLIADAADPVANFVIGLRNVTFDTHSLPVVANYGGHAVTVDLVNENTPSSNDPNITGSFPPGGSSRMNVILSGSLGTPINFGTSTLNVAYSANDGTFGRATVPIDLINKSISIGPAFSLFSTTGPPSAMTSCTVSAGGSVPVGTFFYFYGPIYPGGSEGTMSYGCTATTTTGNQTVTLNWTALPGVTQYSIYRGASLSNVGLGPCSLVTGTTYVDTLASGCGQGGTTLAAGGPSGMRGSLMWTQQMQVGDRAITQSGAGAPSAGLCTTSKGGSLYLRTDGTTTTTFYVCDGATGTWTAK